MVEPFFHDLLFDHRYPKLHYKFIANVHHNDLQSHMATLPLDSTNALEVCERYGLMFGAAHIDAGHNYAAVIKDLKGWWGRIKPGGVLIADDYFDEQNKA